MNNDRDLTKAVVAKIKKQVPDSPEGKLMFAIFQNATLDLFNKAHKSSAVMYMKSDMPHLQAIGIEPVWVRRLFEQAGISKLYT